MPAGRPTEGNQYKPVDKPEGGLVYINEVSMAPWGAEKDVNTALYKNIHDFMERIFGEKVKSATDKKSVYVGATELSTGQALPIRGPRTETQIFTLVGTENGKSSV